jgi:hypothetical protein
MVERWDDPEAPWWVKLRRAGSHIEEVQQRVYALRQAEPWSIQREPADTDGWLYRFRLHRTIPADLSAVVGDAVANMRSALDYIAYELARHHVGTMDDEEDAATAFPICIDKAAFDRFFTDGRKGRLRDRLYGDTERRALQCVQPFALTDEARALGVEFPTDPKFDLLTDRAYVLNALWNIDKHRRLPGLAWAVDGPFWFAGMEDLTSYRWARLVMEHAPLHDGIALCELHTASGSGRPSTDLHQEIELVLTDDPSPYRTSLVAGLEDLHQSLAGWVIPRIFIVADGAPPPIAISFAKPI